MLISFSGTHGTGKTTLVYRLAAELKLATSKNLTTISEVARQCGLFLLFCFESKESAEKFIDLSEPQNNYLKIIKVRILRGGKPPKIFYGVFGFTNYKYNMRTLLERNIPGDSWGVSAYSELHKLTDCLTANWLEVLE